MSANDKNTKPGEKPEPYDAGDEGKVAAKTQESRAREARRMRGLGKVLADADSRYWLWDLLSFCGISRSSFTGNSTTFFNEGQRNVGLKVQGEIVKSFPEQYVSMMKEQSDG